jgi:ribosomal protein S18 acetylase RimI-like enzyme
MKGQATYTLRDVKIEDYAFVYRLHRETLDGHVSDSVYDEDELRQYLFEERLDPRLLKIVAVDGKDVGMVSFSDRETDVFVDRIAVVSGLQPRGIASAVLQDVLEHARRRGVPVTLSVMRTNRSRAIFSGLGFTPFGESDHHYFLQAR